MLDVFGGDDIHEELAQGGALQNHLDLHEEGPGDEHQRESRGALTDEIRGARIHNIAVANHRLISYGLALDEFRDVRRARILAILTTHRGEAIVIVETDQSRKIFLARKLDTLGL